MGGGAEGWRVKAVPQTPFVHPGDVLPDTHGSAGAGRGRGFELCGRRGGPWAGGPSCGRSGGPSGGRPGGPRGASEGARARSCRAPSGACGGTRGRRGRRGRLLGRTQRWRGDRVGRGVPAVAARHRLAALTRVIRPVCEADTRPGGDKALMNM